MPRARSRARAPVGIASIPTLPRSPSRMIGALAELLLDLAEGHVERLVTIHRGSSWSGRRVARPGSGEVAVATTLRRGWDMITWLKFHACACTLERTPVRRKDHRPDRSRGPGSTAPGRGPGTRRGPDSGPAGLRSEAVERLRPCPPLPGDGVACGGGTRVAAHPAHRPTAGRLRRSARLSGSLRHPPAARCSSCRVALRSPPAPTATTAPRPETAHRHAPPRRPPPPRPCPRRAAPDFTITGVAVRVRPRLRARAARVAGRRRGRPRPHGRHRRASGCASASRGPRSSRRRASTTGAAPTASCSARCERGLSVVAAVSSRRAGPRHRDVARTSARRTTRRRTPSFIRVAAQRLRDRSGCTTGRSGTSRTTFRSGDRARTRSAYTELLRRVVDSRSTRSIPQPR